MTTALKVPNLNDISEGELKLAEALEQQISAKATLKHLESRIARGLKIFMEVGQALAIIRDGKLYKGAGYSNFDAYCRERWNMDRHYAHRHIDAAKVAELLPTGQRPANERVARELVPLRHDPVELRVAWNEATAEAEQPTAAVVREKVQARINDEPVDAEVIVDAEVVEDVRDDLGLEARKLTRRHKNDLLADDKLTRLKVRETAKYTRQLVERLIKIEGDLSSEGRQALAAELRKIADELEAP